MKQTISAPNTVPTANIAVNKSRLKVYKNAGSLPTYYLQKGQEFSIELANPTTDVVLAKVILNGKPISQGGLVLNPGQRVYLERYLDVAKKFLFDTYEVSGSEEMKTAIASNGDIKVEFYKERQPYYNTFGGNNTITIGQQFPYNSLINCGGTGTPNQYLRSATNSSGTLGLTGSLTSGSITTTGLNTSVSNNDSVNYSNTSFTSNSTPTLDMLSDNELIINPINPPKVRAKLSKSIETGRVEKGSDSNQEFKYVNKTFEYSAFHTIEYKMLPISQKINTAEDINVKVYCTNCGAKLGKTDKFCASCGTKK